jgi:hypothetical protein
LARLVTHMLLRLLLAADGVAADLATELHSALASPLQVLHGQMSDQCSTDTCRGGFPRLRS